MAFERDHGVLLLHRWLSNYYQKELAQEAVLGVLGAAQVVNRVGVLGHQPDG